MRSETVGEARVAAVDDERVLREVVGPHAEKVRDLGEPVGHHRRGGRLHHHAHRDAARRLDAGPREALPFLRDHLARHIHFLEARDERDHQLDFHVRGGAQGRADLGAEHFGLVETHPNRAPAEERIRFRRGAERRGELVAPQVVGPHHDGMPRKRLAHPPEVQRLLVLGGKAGVRGDQELRAQQAHPFGAVFLGLGDLVGQVHVAAQHDALAVGGDRGLVDYLLHLEVELVATGVAAARLGNLLD